MPQTFHDCLQRTMDAHIIKNCNFKNICFSRAMSIFSCNNHYKNVTIIYTPEHPNKLSRSHFSFRLCGEEDSFVVENKSEPRKTLENIKKIGNILSNYSVYDLVIFLDSEHHADIIQKIHELEKIIKTVAEERSKEWFGMKKVADTKSVDPIYKSCIEWNEQRNQYKMIIKIIIPKNSFCNFNYTRIYRKTATRGIVAADISDVEVGSNIIPTLISKGIFTTYDTQTRGSPIFRTVFHTDSLLLVPKKLENT